MKKIVDAKVSKRPFPVPDEQDLPILASEAERLDKYIEKLKILSSALNESDPGRTLIAACHARMRQIERRRMFIPVSDVTAHAEVVGQWNECLRICCGQIGDDENFLLTGEPKSITSVVNEIQERLKGLWGRMANLKEKLSKNREKEQDNAR